MTSLIALKDAAIGHPITRGRVSFFPVYIRSKDTLITTGPATGITITERPDASVPSLVVHNPTGSPVLLLEGETVCGGQQNRVLNVSVLVPAGATVDIPVSCVEQGRWGGGRGFDRSPALAPRRVRREKLDGVSRNLAEDGSKFSDQGAVWHVVHNELTRLGVNNPTHSLLDTQHVIRQRDDISAAVDELVKLGPLPGQCGVVIAHGGRIVSADIFANPDLLACQWSAIVQAALLDAPGPEVQGRPSASKALSFLRKFSTGEARLAPGVGLGREHHVAAKRLVGQALVWDDLLVHASAFASAA